MKRWAAFLRAECASRTFCSHLFLIKTQRWVIYKYLLRNVTLPVATLFFGCLVCVLLCNTSVKCYFISKLTLLMCQLPHIIYLMFAKYTKLFVRTPRALLILFLSLLAQFLTMRGKYITGLLSRGTKNSITCPFLNFQRISLTYNSFYGCVFVVCVCCGN